MALHQFANDFFTLLGGDKTANDLSKMLDDEICSRRTAMVILFASRGYQVLKPFSDRNISQKR